MNLLIHNATIVTMQRNRIIHDGTIAIEGEDIIEVGKTRELKAKYRRGYDRINAEGKIVIPGMINTHQHAAMSLLRGYADDLPLQEWLEKWIWPIEKHMTPHDVYIGALLTAAESIMSGVTTVNTMYHCFSEVNEAKAFADAHLRGVVGHVCFSWRKKEDRYALENLAKNWHGQCNGLIRVSVDPHAPYSVDPEYWKELSTIREDLERRYGSNDAPVIFHTHIGETSDENRKTRKAFKSIGNAIKAGIMSYLDSLGVLSKYVLAAHCVALNNLDLDIVKKRRVKVSHNPVSNLKLGSGISPVPQMLKKGIVVSLGTDSPCSNNTADILNVIRTAALIHKGICRDPTLMPAQKVMNMATIEGARALSWEEEIGSIEEGKRADLAIVSFKKPHLHPLYNEVSHLVYSVNPADVETVVINGDIVMENRQLTRLKLTEIVDTAEKAKNDLVERAL